MAKNKRKNKNGGQVALAAQVGRKARREAAIAAGGGPRPVVFRDRRAHARKYEARGKVAWD